MRTIRNLTHHTLCMFLRCLTTLHIKCEPQSTRYLNLSFERDSLKYGVSQFLCHHN